MNQAAVVMTNSGMAPLDRMIELSQVKKSYQRGKTTVEVLKGVDMKIGKGAFTALMGPSGSGKSTLLNLIAGLDRASSGRVEVDGRDIGKLSERERARFRADKVGFVFQTYNLMPVLSAAENVELPLLLSSLSRSERRKRVHTALRVVGLSERAKHRPDELSGGQQQRVAVARAIATDPAIIVADEPTGDLDRESADEVLTLLQKLNTELDKTILMVTHDPAAAARAQVTLHLDKGVLQQ